MMAPAPGGHLATHQPQDDSYLGPARRDSGFKFKLAGPGHWVTPSRTRICAAHAGDLRIIIPRVFARPAGARPARHGPRLSPGQATTPSRCQNAVSARLPGRRGQAQRRRLRRHAAGSLAGAAQARSVTTASSTVSRRDSDTSTSSTAYR